MGALIEKAENAFAEIEAGYERLAPERDGLIKSLYGEDLKKLCGIARQIRHMAENELARREKEAE